MPDTKHPLYPSEKSTDRTLDAVTFQSVYQHDEARRAANEAAYEAHLRAKAAKKAQVQR